MNGFSTVEKLKELEQRATPEKWQLHEGQQPGSWEIMAEGKPCQEFDIIFEDSDMDDPKFIADLRNAAPMLLDIAGLIRPEDGKRFASMIRTMENDIEWDHDREIDLLRRYQKMAERMHEDHH